MNRFRKAWLALTGRLEPEVREVVKEREVFVPVGGPVADVFVANSRTYEVELKNFGPALHRWKMINACGGSPERPTEPSAPEWHGRVYRSCAQAFDECGRDANVQAKKAIVDGDAAYVFYGLDKCTLQPKPKRAKGR